MEMLAGAAIICLAAAIAIWANDRLPHNESEDQLLELPAE